MSENVFDYYEEIVNQYIARLANEESVFSSTKDDKINRHAKNLSQFLQMIEVQESGAKFYTVTKAMLCAKEGSLKYYNYKRFNELAHLVLTQIPELWKHFMMILKVYDHHEPLAQLKADEKIVAKFREKKALIDQVDHEYNKLLEFLCPRLDGRLIAWQEGVLEDPQVADIQGSYPINIVKNLLQEQPYLPENPVNISRILQVLKDYIDLKIQAIENIPSAIQQQIFEFIYQHVKQHSGSLRAHMGDYAMDLCFKDTLNPFVDVFELNHLLDYLDFTDNWCHVTLKNHKQINLDIETLEGWQASSKRYLLIDIIRFVEKKVNLKHPEFFVDIGT